MRHNLQEKRKEKEKGTLPLKEKGTLPFVRIPW
jgi:hypothetical protein